MRRLGLNFKGRSELYAHHLTVPHHELNIIKDKSVGKATGDDNLIIHGDNLRALKALLPRYEGKIKCIYIDPPYNTGSDAWIYNDNVSSPTIREWIGGIVDINDLERHDKWLCMMWPRLQLLRELLSEDGVIFISIDDNEQHRLRLIMDEIFGEDNFFGIFAIKTPNHTEDKNRLKNMDFLVSYTKTKDKFKFYVDDKPQTARCTTGKESQTQSEIIFPSGIEVVGVKDGTYNQPKQTGKNEDVKVTKGKIVVKDGKLAQPVTLIARWSNPNDIKAMIEKYNTNSQEPVFNKFTKELTRLWIKGKRFQPQMDKIGGDLPESIWCDFTKIGSKILKVILPNADFPYPKHPDLIKNIIKLSTNENSIILDSFAGSGTTAHAILELNKEDKGNRKFILTQCDEYDKKTNKEIDICHNITAERIRRIIKGVPKAKDKTLQKGLGGSFTYYEIGEAIDFKKIITKERLPKYDSLAGLLFSQITGKPIIPKEIGKEKWYIGQTEKYKVYLIYDNKKKFLESPESHLTLDFLQKITKKLKEGQQAVIFASGRYVDESHLREKNSLFFYIPHELHKHLDKK